MEARRHGWKERSLAAIIFAVAFAVIYGGVAMLPHYTELDGSLPIDNAIPFIPAFIALYFAADIIVVVPIALIGRNRVARYTGALLIMLVVAAIFFVAMPIKMEKEVRYDGTVWSSLAAVQHEYDSAFNNFPSLHVAFTLFATLALWREDRRWGYAALPLALGVVASVVLVKQHLFIDIIGGVALAAGIYWWYEKNAPSSIESWVERSISTASSGKSDRR